MPVLIQAAGGNPKTTILGVLTILAALVNAGIQALHGQPVDMNSLVLAISSGLTLIGYAHDPAKVAVATPPPEPPAPPAAAFARLGFLPMLLAACVLLTGCPLLKGSSITATANGEAANIAVTLPDGADVGVTIANSQVCVAGPFVPLPIFNFECDTACGTLVGTIGVSLTCRVVGTEGPTFPWQFALTKKQQEKAVAMVARNPSALRMRAP